MKSKITALLLFISLIFTACNNEEKQFDKLRDKYLNTILIDENTDINNPIIAKRIAQVDANVEGILKLVDYNQEKDWYFTDLTDPDNYVDRFSQISITSNLLRFEPLATAYNLRGSKFYKDPKIRDIIIDGMNWTIDNKWSPKYPMYGNWWEWIIGIPMSINNIIALMYDDIPQELIDRTIESLNYYAPNVTFEGASTGANKVWQCFSMIIRGIIAKDKSMIDMGVDGLNTEFLIVESGDGFYRDGSFVQHQWHPYNGGYGRSLLIRISAVADLLYGTDWQLDDEKMNMLIGWCQDAFLPFISDGAVMNMVTGRENSRDGQRPIGHSILLSCYQIGKMAQEAKRDSILGIVKYHIKRDTVLNFLANSTPLPLVGEFTEFLADDSIKEIAPSAKVRVYANMDRAIYSMPNFTYTLAMSSSRIENYETINGENLKGWHIGDGMSYLYNDDLTQYENHYYVTIDSYYMPGTTVDIDSKHKAETLDFAPGLLYADGYKSPYSWVGGSAVEDCGMIGMAFKDEKSSLDARKNWMMVDGKVIALGAGINSNDNHRIVTVVDNRKLNPSHNQKIISKGNNVIIEGKTTGTTVGYYTLDNSKIDVKRGMGIGFASDINVRHPHKEYKDEYATLTLNHGRNPKNATYAYVTVPSVTKDEFDKIVKGNNIEIISNTPDICAVTYKGQDIKVLGVNFWEPSSINTENGTISSTAAASVTVKKSGNNIKISISDPTQLATNNISIQLPYSAANIVNCNSKLNITSLNPIKIEFNPTKSLGQSQIVEFTIE